MYKTLLVFTLLSFFNLNGQAPVDSVQLKIADSLFAEADKAYATNPDSAIVLINTSVTICKKAKAWEPYIDRLNILSAVYYYRNEFDLQKEYMERAYQDGRNKLPPTHPHIAATLNNLMTYYFNLGDYRKSIELLRKSLEIKQANNPNALDLAFSYNNIGTSLTQQGEYPEALEYLSKALELRQDTFANNPIAEIGEYIINSKTNIAFAYQKNEELDVALNYYQESFSDLKLLSGKETIFLDRERINILQSIAKIYYLKEDYNASEIQIKKALRFQKKRGCIPKTF